jgi:hypothetical protein
VSPRYLKISKWSVIPLALVYRSIAGLSSMGRFYGTEQLVQHAGEDDVRVEDGLRRHYSKTELLHRSRLRRVKVDQERKRTVATGIFGRHSHHMGRLEDFRNAPMHSRALVNFEQKLIQGMTGEIRNKVTLFQTEANEADRHFPRIEFVRDSFGQQASDGVVPTGITVHPGDEVTFECSGWDPEDRPLRWTLDVLGTLSSTDKEGATCHLAWRVTDEHISEGTFARIRLRSDRAWHRYSAGHDGVVTLRYAVLPR